MTVSYNGVDRCKGPCKRKVYRIEELIGFVLKTSKSWTYIRIKAWGGRLTTRGVHTDRAKAVF